MFLKTFSQRQSNTLPCCSVYLGCQATTSKVVFTCFQSILYMLVSLYTQRICRRVSLKPKKTIQIQNYLLIIIILLMIIIIIIVIIIHITTISSSSTSSSGSIILQRDFLMDMRCAKSNRTHFSKLACVY